MKIKMENQDKIIMNLVANHFISNSINEIIPKEYLDVSKCISENEDNVYFNIVQTIIHLNFFPEKINQETLNNTQNINLSDFICIPEDSEKQLKNYDKYLNAIKIITDQYRKINIQQQKVNTK